MGTNWDRYRNSEQAEIPPAFSHSVKIEQTGKGARITVHVFASSSESAIQQALEMYGATKKYLELKGEVVAPIEVGKKE